MNTASLLLRRIVRARFSTALGCVVLAFAVSRCIAEDGACSEHQVTSGDETYTCKCADGYVLDTDSGYGCVACKKNETSSAGACVCKEGYSRPDEKSPCEKTEGSVLGSECSAEQSCTAPNPYCAETQSPAYCTTQDCSENDDCPSMWRCDKAGDVAFCKKPPTGLGDSCDTSADCAGNEAGFCETFMTRTCIINKCASQPSVCPSQLVCCDLTALIGEALCIDAAVLTNGLCPGGTKPVTE
jgi:hypothetical protein